MANIISNRLNELITISLFHCLGGKILLRMILKLFIKNVYSMTLRKEVLAQV